MNTENSREMPAPAPLSRAIEPNAIYTAQEAAVLLAINPTTMHRKLEAGIIKGSKKIGRWRVRGSELLKCG